MSLLCPIGRSVIHTPVRGPRCKHTECFDEANWRHFVEQGGKHEAPCPVCHTVVHGDAVVQDRGMAAMLENARHTGLNLARLTCTYDGEWRLSEADKGQGSQIDVTAGSSIIVIDDSDDDVIVL